MSETAICIIVTGLQCSGKTSFLKEALRQDCVGVEWSEVIYEDIGRPNKQNRTEWLKCVCQRVASKGIDYYPSMIYQNLTSKGHGIHVVSGARNSNELDMLLRMYSHTAVVWVETDTTIRLSRAKTRARRDAPLDLLEFIRHDHEELINGLAEIGSQQITHCIVNNDSYESYSQSISDFLKNVKEKGCINARV